jgi:dTDP-4-amino-4,6-dideoxygalactose transaminase
MIVYHVPKHSDDLAKKSLDIPVAHRISSEQVARTIDTIAALLY